MILVLKTDAENKSQHEKAHEWFVEFEEIIASDESVDKKEKIMELVKRMSVWLSGIVDQRDEELEITDLRY
jgi:hypothetical protein